MAHFAEVDKNSIVLRVVVTDNFMPKEGLTWLRQRLGGIWIQTSYNTSAGLHKLGKTPFRKNYAGIGYSYNSTLDAFIPPQPYPSWILAEDTCQWSAPINHPDGDDAFIWDEASVNWIPVDPE